MIKFLMQLGQALEVSFHQSFSGIKFYSGEVYIATTIFILAQSFTVIIYNRTLNKQDNVLNPEKTTIVQYRQ